MVSVKNCGYMAFLLALFGLCFQFMTLFVSPQQGQFALTVISMGAQVSSMVTIVVLIYFVKSSDET